MTNFVLRFDKSEIEAWSARYSYPIEDAVVEAGTRSAEQGFYIRQDFLLVGDWKSPRARKKRESNAAEYVETVTQCSFAAKDERLRIEVLRLLSGVEWPTASTLLHLAFPETYPILDYRALWSLGIEMRPSLYAFDFWTEYAEFCRELASRAQVSMRTLDRALWQFSKENQ